MPPPAGLPCCLAPCGAAAAARRALPPLPRAARPPLPRRGRSSLQPAAFARKPPGTRLHASSVWGRPPGGASVSGSMDGGDQPGGEAPLSTLAGLLRSRAIMPWSDT